MSKTGLMQKMGGFSDPTTTQSGENGLVIEPIDRSRDWAVHIKR